MLTVSCADTNRVRVLGEELDGREALDLNILQFVGGGVHFGNDDLVVILELGSQLVPDGNQLFAVSAPGGV